MASIFNRVHNEGGPVARYLEGYFDQQNWALKWPQNGDTNRSLGANSFATRHFPEISLGIADRS